MKTESCTVERDGHLTIVTLVRPEVMNTDRKFNRMRPSMARVLGLETRSAKEG